MSDYVYVITPNAIHIYDIDNSIRWVYSIDKRKFPVAPRRLILENYIKKELFGKLLSVSMITIGNASLMFNLHGESREVGRGTYFYNNGMLIRDLLPTTEEEKVLFCLQYPGIKFLPDDIEFSYDSSRNFIDYVTWREKREDNT